MKTTTLLFCLILPVQAQAGELSALLQDALSHPSVAAAKNQEAAAREELSAATGKYFGSATVSSGWHRFEGPRILGVFVPGSTPLLSDKIVQTSVSYSVPVDLFGAISATRDEAKQDVRIAEFSKRQQVLYKLHEVSTAYLTLQSLFEQKKALDLYGKRVDLTVKRMEKEVELGHAAQVEALYATSEASRVAADAAALQGNIEKAQADLFEASGRKGFVPASENIVIPKWEGIDAELTLPAQIADSRSESAKARREAAKAALLPSLSLDASYFNFRTPSSLERNLWQVGGAVSLPIGTTQYSQYESQKLAAMAAGEEKTAVLREAQKQLSEIIAEYRSAMSDVRATEKEIAYREKVVEVQREMQKLGSQTLENLFIHEHDLLDAQTRLDSARARAAIAWSAAQVLSGMPESTYIEKMQKP